jgi:hypothetical protein
MPDPGTEINERPYHASAQGHETTYKVYRVAGTHTSWLNGGFHFYIALGDTKDGKECLGSTVCAFNNEVAANQVAELLNNKANKFEKKFW